MAHPFSLATESGANVFLLRGHRRHPMRHMKIMWDKPPRRMEVESAYRAPSESRWRLMLPNGERDWLRADEVFASDNRKTWIRVLDKLELKKQEGGKLRPASEINAQFRARERFSRIQQEAEIRYAVWLRGRLAQRRNELTKSGGRGIRWLKVGTLVWQSINMMAAETIGLPPGPATHFQGIPVVLDMDIGPKEVCFYG